GRAPALVPLDAAHRARVARVGTRSGQQEVGERAPQDAGPKTAVCDPGCRSRVADARERVPAYGLRRPGEPDAGTAKRTRRGQGPRGAARGRCGQVVGGGQGPTASPREVGHAGCGQRGPGSHQGWRTGGWDHTCGSRGRRGAAL
ncbi:MAG: Cell division protein FtsL, partial [uncultured Rubrobacteraceae bacterium]